MATKPSKKQLRFTDENYWIRASLLVIGAALLIVNTFYVVHRMTQPALPAPTIYTSQQTAQTKAMTVSVSNISENSQSDPAFTLDDGQIILIADVSVTNNTGQEQDFIPSSQLYTRTPQGDYSALHASMFVKKQIYAGKIKPGQTVSGQVSFSVPDKATTVYMYVDTAWANEPPVVFSVLN